MPRSRSHDQYFFSSLSERRAWQQAERRVRREHELEQLAALSGLAASGGEVTGMTSESRSGSVGLMAEPVEFIIEGRRLRLGRTHRPTLSKLRDGLARAARLPLTRVQRYGPYWVLTFKVATEQLVLLVEQLTLLPDFGGGGAGEGAPRGPLSYALA
jgi:hypothetical protein